MLRLKQRILLIVTCVVACVFVYALYTRHSKPASNIPLASDKGSSGVESSPQHEKESPASVAPPPNAASVSRELRTVALEPVKTNCKIYQELRNVDFQQPTLKNALCKDFQAYERVNAGKYPMCTLPKPFDERLMSVVREGSSIVDLKDMKDAMLKMYIYPERDYISEMIRRDHQWEPGLVHTTLRFAMRVPNATFLDAGCNIGVYSVLAARLGLPVVSLDANIRNLLRLRLTLSAASLDAALVWNFIGSGDELSYLNFPEDCNVGGATKFGRAVKDTIPVMPVRSESLCSLIKTKNIIIKLDVEGGEADFLRTSGRLFSDFKVAAVQMEWLRRHMEGNDSSAILHFFTSRRYSAWRTPELTELDTKAAKSWGDGDFLWVHEDFKGLVGELLKGA